MFGIVIKKHCKQHVVWLNDSLECRQRRDAACYKLRFVGDGHNWNREGLAVPYKHGRGQAFSRPTVMGNIEAGYKMYLQRSGGPGDGGNPPIKVVEIHCNTRLNKKSAQREDILGTNYNRH